MILSMDLFIDLFIFMATYLSPEVESPTEGT